MAGSSEMPGDEASGLASEAPRSAAPRLSYVIGRLDRAVRRELAERLEPAGLTLQQFTALSVLKLRPGLSNAQLARRAMITPQSMIAVISVLESRGLVARSVSPTHARVLQAVLTEAGGRALTACERAVDELEEQMTAGLEPEEGEKFLELMRGWVRQLGGGL